MPPWCVQDYKEWLESMMKTEVKDEVPLVADYSEHHSDADVLFRSVYASMYLAGTAD